MRRVEQTLLFMRDARVDKVYEVDLCEVAQDQWVVNFRYGRRGAVLREGSRTPIPVPEAEARRVYQRLVTSKRVKGYGDADPGPPPAAEESSEVRHGVLRRYLDAPQGSWTSLDGVIHRIGELRVPGCTERLTALLPDAPDRTVYNIVRALLRCGDQSAVPDLHMLWSSEERPGHLRQLAGHALCVHAAPEDRARFMNAERERLSPALLGWLRAEDVTRFSAELRDQPRTLDRLYMVHTPAERPHLLAMLSEIDVRPPLWQGVRGVLRAAEARGDGPVYGALIRRIHRTGPGGVGFRAPTRNHFVRRSWRTLFRLGSAGCHADYAALAAGVLGALRDEDRGTPFSRVSRWDWRTRTSTVVWTAPFGDLWAANHILYGRSPQFRHRRGSLTWRLVDDVPPSEIATDTRTERFPEAWDAHPEYLVDLLASSRCEIVHQFAVRALRANRESWAAIEIEALGAMLAAPYACTGDLCIDIATERFVAADPDLELVMMLVGSSHAPARALGQGWIRDNVGPYLADATVVTGLVLSPHADTRATALDVLVGGAVPAAIGRDVVQAVLSFARTPEARNDVGIAILRDAAVLLQAAFPADVRAIPLDQIVELVKTEAEGIAELGARLLLGHEVAPADLPDALLVALLTSPLEPVRGIGLRLYAELPPAVLVERFRVLCDLVTHPLADVRHGARPLVQKLVAADPTVADRLVAALIPALVIDGPEGMHDSVVMLLRDELAEACARLDRDAILRLVGATETVVQSLGGELLVHVDPATLTLLQLITMAASDILSVRRSSWAMLPSRVDDARANLESVLGLLDAEWEDTRQFGMQYLEEHIGVATLGADLVVAICDSVKPDIQAFGRRTITHMFETDDGPTYLLKLAQHPATEMQQFVSAWLSAHAAGHPERVYELVPYFVGVMTRPNQGRVAKARVLAFLEQESASTEAGAQVAAQVASSLAMSEARTHRAWAIRVLNQIRRRWPHIDNPLQVRAVEVRDGV